MKTKKFDQELFDANDPKGRAIVIKFFKTLNIDACPNPDVYAVDLILYRGEKKVGYAEVEVRYNWKTDEFPYDTLNVPARKKKLLENDLPTYFFSVNCIETRMFVATDWVVLASPLRESKNKEVASGEYFYKVPVGLCKMIVI